MIQFYFPVPLLSVFFVLQSVIGSSHGYAIYGIGGIFSNARSNAPVALDERGRPLRVSSLQGSSESKGREPKEKTMSEAIEAAKKTLARVLGEDAFNGEGSQDDSDEILFEVPAFTQQPTSQQQPYSPSAAPTDHQEVPTPINDVATTNIPLIGEVILSKLLITEQLRVGTTKSELFKCYHISDNARENPFVIKISRNAGQIELEHRIYRNLFSRTTKDQKGLFATAYDFVDASPMTGGRTGFVMECGLENLRGYIWRNGAYTGEKLRKTMRDVIRIVHTLHSLGIIWTEVKAENLIVFGSGETIKAVDLESFTEPNTFLRAYTAETYPPEFPADMLYEGIPQIPLDYSFDIYGLGLVLFEMATGEPLFTLQRTYDVDYIKERLRSPQGIVDEANLKLQSVDPDVRKIILRCLVVDPQERSTCDELLKDNFFQCESPDLETNAVE